MALSEKKVSGLLFGTVATIALVAAASLVFAPLTQEDPKPKDDKTSGVDCKDVLKSPGNAHPLQILGCHMKNGFAFRAD